MRLVLVAILALAATALVAPPAGGGRLRSSGIASADLRMGAGHSKTILRVRGVGRWTATCSARGHVGVAFTADHLLPTSDLVVTRTDGPPLARRVDPGDTVEPDPAGAVLAQRWQIAPFAAAQVQVTAATVAARSTGEKGGYACAASVVAVTGPDQGATRTG